MKNATTPRTYQPATDYSLRSYKEHRELSEETKAFTAKLYRGDVHVGDVRNDGQGGPPMVRLNDREETIAFRETIKGLPEGRFPESMGGGTFTRGEEGFIDVLVAETEAFKHAKKYFTLIHEDEDIEDGFSTIKLGRSKMKADDPRVAQYLANNPEYIQILPR